METINNKCSDCIYNGECKLDPNNCMRYCSEDNIAYGTIGSEELHQDYTIAIGYGWPKIKSHLKIGNMTIYNTHHFNWLERKMWKLFFGFDIENVEE